MDLMVVFVLLLISSMFAISFIVFIIGLFALISFFYQQSLSKPTYRARVSMAMDSCPNSLYGKRFMLTGTAKQYMMNIGTIVGFSRMHNEHLANLVGKTTKQIEEYLLAKTKEGVRLPPKEFWLDVSKLGNKALEDLLFVNYVIVVPKIFSFLIWFPPALKFLPKHLILFLDSQLANPNKELFGDIWIYGVNLNMVHYDYWFVDTERITRSVITMMIRSDAYVYELIESYHNVSEVAKNLAKTHKDLIEQMSKNRATVGVTNLGQTAPDDRMRT